MNSNVSPRHKENTIDTYGIFWDEYRSIEQSNPTAVQQSDVEDGPEKEDKNESEIQWLNDVGFTNIAKKIRARTEIDRNDDDMKIIAASLTRAQANAVRRRIDSLNDAIRQHKAEEEKDISRTRSRNKRKDVRNLFDNSATSNTHTTNRVIQTKLENEKLTENNTLNVVAQRFVNTPENDVSRKVNNVDLTSRDVLSPDHQKTADISDNELERLSLITDGSTSKLSPTFQRFQKESPQIDNLVRRTSGSHLIFMTGEERERALQSKIPPSVVRRHTDVGLRPVGMEANPSRKIPGGDVGGDSREFNLRRLHRGADESFNKHFVRGGEKRLVVVDSKYINVSSVTDTYQQHPVNKDLKRSATYTNADIYNTCQVRIPVVHFHSTSPVHEDEPTPNTLTHTHESAHTIKNRDIQNNYQNHMDLTNYVRPQSPNYENEIEFHKNISSNKSYALNNSKETSSKCRPGSLPVENICVTITPNHKAELQPIYSSSHTDALDNAINDLSSIAAELKLQNATAASKGLVDVKLESRERKHPRRVHSEKTTISDTLNNERNMSATSEIKLLKTKSSPFPNEKPSPDLNRASRNKIVSDDDKSLSSFGSRGGSSDELQQSSPLSDKSFGTIYGQLGARDDTQKARSSMTSIGSVESINPSSRGGSPGLGLEGDAKLNVGSISLSQESSSSFDVVAVPMFPPLPNFTLTREELGMTHIGDLSLDDMNKVRPLALLELTALFDTCNIPMNRRKPLNTKQKYKDSGMFGVPLTQMCHREKNKKDPTVKAPRLFREMLRFLENHGLHEEGILRIPGSSTRVKQFREECEKNKLQDVSFEGKKVSDIATCLKQFLRDLPIPLLSYEYQNTFSSVANLPDRKIQLQALNLLVLLLDLYHQETLRCLLVFLNKIISNESKNKMGLNNVAMIMAPNLFFQNNAKIGVHEASKAADMTDVLRMLIKYQTILWTVPSFMVGQIRCLYEAGTKTKDPKAVRKIIVKRLKTEGPITSHSPRGKSSGSSGDELEDHHQETIIRVKAPSLNKQSMAIALLENTTAADVIAKFQWRRQNSQKEKDEIDTSRLSINNKSKKKNSNLELFLCEAGGNIGERKLDPGANLMAVLRVNPNTEWVLKGRVKRNLYASKLE